MVAWKRLAARFGRFLMPLPHTRIELRLRLPLLWLAALLVAALLLPDRVWTTFLVGLGGLVLIAFVWTRQVALGLDGARRLRYGWISVGDRLEEEFHLGNRSAFPALWVEVNDESNIPGYQASVVRALGGRETVHWRQSSVCTRRGQYQLGPWSLRTGDPFGIFVATHQLSAGQEIIIHPPIHSQLPIPLPPGRSEGRARVVQRAWQATINAASVRDYQHLDPYHWIHWPTSARRDGLYVRQFDRDAAGDLWLLLDAEAAVQLGRDEDSTEEQAVLIAASLAARAQQETRAIGLASYGRVPQVVRPGLGAGQQWSILRALALLHADGETGIGRAMQELAESGRRGSAAIIITPDAGPEWVPSLLTLARSGIESHVLLLDRPSFGGEGNTIALQQAIVAEGFHCQVIHRGEVGRPIVEEEHRGFWEFKVTGTGKAVAVRRPGER